MKVGNPSLRLGLTLVIVLMVVSSPSVMLVNPASVYAAAAPVNPDSSNPADSSSYHSTLQTTQTSTPSTSFSSSTPTTSAPPVSSKDGGDFTTQAALSLTRASQTNNFVASKAYYDISFRTTTAGAIKTVQMNFPAGTTIGSALLVEATGIGPGTISAISSQILEYTVTNAVNIPANTIIRIQISNINNPPTPSGSFTVSITTRNAANGIIDGPTATSAYNMVQVGNTQIAPGAVTTTKIATGAVGSTDVAESFMKRVTIFDTAGGNAVGWNPDGVQTIFSITTEDIDSEESLVTVNVHSNTFAICNVFDTDNGTPGAIDIACTSAPSEGSSLHYVISNLPEHLIF